MTYLASSLNPDRQAHPAAQTHGMTNRSGSGATASEATPQPRRVEGPHYSTWQIVKLYVLCAALGFAAMAMAHTKMERDLNLNWERINDR